MDVKISNKLCRRFQTLEECDDLSEIEVAEYLQEVIEDLLEDHISARLNKQESSCGEDENDYE